MFDKSVFPFADLHPNAGAIFQKEILLLPQHLLGGVNCADPNTTNELPSDDAQGAQEFPTEEPDVIGQGDLSNPEVIAQVPAEDPSVRSENDLATDQALGSEQDSPAATPGASDNSGATPMSTCGGAGLHPASPPHGVSGPGFSAPGFGSDVATEPQLLPESTPPRPIKDSATKRYN